jgi:hypothetical protein
MGLARCLSEFLPQCGRGNLRVVHGPVPLLQLQQLGLPALLRFVEHAAVLQWGADSVVSHGLLGVEYFGGSNGSDVNQAYTATENID